ncbi:MAG: endosialidase [Eubacteriales bacterium]|nr:endosialidase [Eubacteriales bacterium]
MAIAEDLIHTQEDGKLSFGNYTLPSKQKKEGFAHGGDLYKVKTFREMTKLECNDNFVYESVPGTGVRDFQETEEGMSFVVEGAEDAQITLGLQEETGYEVFADGRSIGQMSTGLGGKLNISLELAGSGEVAVEIRKLA